MIDCRVIGQDKRKRKRRNLETGWQAAQHSGLALTGPQGTPRGAEGDGKIDVAHP